MFHGLLDCTRCYMIRGIRVYSSRIICLRRQPAVAPSSFGVFRIILLEDQGGNDLAVASEFSTNGMDTSHTKTNADLSNFSLQTPQPVHTAGAVRERISVSTGRAGLTAARTQRRTMGHEDHTRLHKHRVVVKNLASTHGAPILFLVPRSTGASSTHDVVAGRELPRALRGIAPGTAIAS